MGIREQRRAEIEAEILRVARAHLATDGAAGLSLRAVARDLGMVSSGVYRYVESRDELLTRLIVAAYSSLAEHVTAVHDAVAAIAPGDIDGRWDAIGRALREWALSNPHDFALVYGSPVPGYDAPAERTTGPGTAVPGLLVQLMVDAVAAGRVHTGPVGPVVSAPAGDAPLDEARLAARAVAGFMEERLFAGTGLTSEAVARGLSAWTLLLAAVTAEVFGQLGPIPDAEALFEWQSAVARTIALGR